MTKQVSIADLEATKTEGTTVVANAFSMPRKIVVGSVAGIAGAAAGIGAFKGTAALLATETAAEGAIVAGLSGATVLGAAAAAAPFVAAAGAVAGVGYGVYALGRKFLSGKPEATQISVVEPQAEAAAA